MSESNKNHLAWCIEYCGGQTALAEKVSEVCGEEITQSHIWNWLNRSKKGVPADMCHSVCKAVDLKKAPSDFYPSLWPVSDREVA